MAPSEDGSAHPDYRFTLANERTLLAWLRTGLALVAGGVAVAAYVPNLGARWASSVVALALVLIGLGTSVAECRGPGPAARDDGDRGADGGGRAGRRPVGGGPAGLTSRGQGDAAPRCRHGCYLDCTDNRTPELARPHHRVDHRRPDPGACGLR